MKRVRKVWPFAFDASLAWVGFAWVLVRGFPTERPSSSAKKAKPKDTKNAYLGRSDHKVRRGRDVQSRLAGLVANQRPCTNGHRLRAHRTSRIYCSGIISKSVQIAWKE